MQKFPANLIRPAICALLVLLLCTVTVSDVSAASPSRTALQATIERVLSMLADPAYNNQATQASQRAKIEDEIRKVFDFKEFAARTVGQRWRTFSPAQQAAFSEAFADLLLTTYLGQLDRYNGEKIRYTGERSNEAGTRVEQMTELNTSDKRIIPVSYRMMPKNGTWVVYDVIVEGVSLVKNYRTQFQDILATATPDDLTRRIRDKANEIRNRKKDA